MRYAQRRRLDPAEASPPRRRPQSRPVRPDRPDRPRRATPWTGVLRHVTTISTISIFVRVGSSRPEEARMTAEISTRELIDVEDWGIQPGPETYRRLRLLDFAVLWGDLAVSLLVIVAGSLLVPALSTQEALAVIVVGTLAGTVLLVAAGVVGSRTEI